MSRRRPRTRRARVGVLLAAAAASGCAPPDRWGVFEDRLDHATRRAAEARGPAPPSDPHAPRPAPGIELPEAPPPGQPLELSLEHAVIAALARNRDLSVEQLGPVITGAFEGIERGVFDPEVFAEFEYFTEESSETNRATGSRFSVIGDEAQGVAGIRQRLPTGTDLEASVTQRRTSSNRSPEQQEARVGLTVTQALLQGFGPAVNLAGVRLAELDTLASVYELRGFTEALVADVETAYWNYVLIKEEIAIFEESLRIAERQRDQVEQRIEVGVLAETEAAAARAEVALREQELIDARAALEAQRLLLLRLIDPGPGADLDTAVTAISDPQADPAALDDLADRLALAERSRPDLAEARLRLEQGRLDTLVTRNGLLPRLELFLALGKTGFEDTFTGSFERLDEQTDDLTVGVRFSHLLGNRAAEARDRAARATREQAARAVSNLRQFVRFEVRRAATELERARQQIAASAATRRLQEQALEAEQQRFDVGSSTALLVAQVQRDLLAARIAEVEAVVNYRIARVRLYVAEGSLLARRGIRVPGAELLRVP